MKYHKDNNKSYISHEISKILTDLINSSIVNTKNKKCRIILKHCNENSFSMADARKFIDNLKLNGVNTKILLIDYIDVMIPSNQKHTTYNDYDAHGEIIQEMRIASRLYSIPIISITQNTRESENMNQTMGNNLIADSFKKVRYSDYIYMIRLRSDADLLHPQVKQDVNNDGEQLSMMDITGQYFQSLVPMEIKITKAKEGKKNVVKFHLFSGLNLRIYDSLSSFTSDVPSFKIASDNLQNQIEMLELNCIQGPQSDLIGPNNFNMLV